jgi:hypothetical protein
VYRFGGSILEKGGIGGFLHRCKCAAGEQKGAHREAGKPQTATQAEASGGEWMIMLFLFPILLYHSITSSFSVIAYVYTR